MLKSFRNWLSALPARFVRRRAILAPDLHRLKFHDRGLGRAVTVDVLLPPSYSGRKGPFYPLLLLNDGQDIPALGLRERLDELYAANSIPGIIVAGIHAGDRLQEFGIAGKPDYLGRGSRAGAYMDFVVRRLIPWLRKNYPLSPPGYAIAGFSLGGLSAFDIAWNNPSHFDRAGVFSGALWWRSEPFRPEAPDANRMAHAMVRGGKRREGFRFWFQTGTEDEQSDRNRNGIIDAIDDTLHLMDALCEKGYQADLDMVYHEVNGGRHEPATWGRAFPAFLQWAFPRQRAVS